MTVECADACQKFGGSGTEPEQCAGWAVQGECTRNAKYMMVTCPMACKEQRSQMHDGALDDRADCLDLATPERCIQDRGLQSECKGTCEMHALCADEADPAECERALRCRELKDDWATCKAKVEQSGCENDATLLKHCYLSCARHGRASLLRRYRLTYSVRTRQFGVLDEEPRTAGRRVGSSALPLPCWKGTIFDPPPPSTCNNTRAQLLHRWRRMAEPRCEVLRHTTPRVASRRPLSLPLQHAPRRSLGVEPLVPLLRSDAAADGAAEAGVQTDTLQQPDELVHPDLAPERMAVMPLLASPKVRLVEHFVSAEEAKHMIDIGLPRMHRSLAGGRQESIRTSTTAMLPAQDPVVRRVTERAAWLTGYPYGNIEPLQLVKYVDGQKYEPHFDYGEACDYEENLANGHRHVTMLVYLNTVPKEYGGHTSFPKLNLQLSPSAHTALVFNDCLPNGQEDPRTLHGGSPPSNVTKIAINIWIRAKQHGAQTAGGLLSSLVWGS